MQVLLSKYAAAATKSITAVADFLVDITCPPSAHQFLGTKILEQRFRISVYTYSDTTSYAPKKVKGVSMVRTGLVVHSNTVSFPDTVVTERTQASAFADLGNTKELFRDRNMKVTTSEARGHSQPHQRPKLQQPVESDYR